MVIKDGSLGCLQAAVADSGYANVGLLSEISGTHEQKTIDVTPMCGASSFIQRLTGIQKITYEASGRWDDYGDVVQKLCLDNAANDATLWLKFLYDGTLFVKSQAVVDKFTIKAKPDGVVEFKLSAQSTGPITHG
jgi:predicted secreted protein